MDTLILMHDIEDAKHCVVNKLYTGAVLLSTHPSIDIWLKEEFDLPCQCLSSYIESNEVLAMQKESVHLCLGILDELEHTISPLINRKYNLKMRYFIPAYSYFASFQHLTYRLFVHSLKNALAVNRVKRLRYYDRRLDDFLHATTTIVEIIHTCFSDVDSELLKYEKQGKKSTNRIKRINKKLSRLKRRPLKTFNKLIRMAKILALSRFSTHKKTIIVQESLYDLDFLKSEPRLFSRYNVLYYKHLDTIPRGFKNRITESDFDIDLSTLSCIHNHSDGFKKFLLRDIESDIKRRLALSLHSILELRYIMSEFPISLGLWGNSPILDKKPFFFEYLLSENIPVVGAQHGGSYAEARNPWLFETELDRCSHFISYGFNKDDVSRLFPDKHIKAHIFPLGSTRIFTPKGKKKEIEILFPPTTVASIFHGGKRTLPDRIVTRQIQILLYLDSLRKKNVYVKLAEDSDYESCAILPLLKKLKNITVVFDRNLLEFIEDYSPRIVIIESYSTPLYEVLPLDCEIFVMNDELIPLEENALFELKKRAHFFCTTDELLKNVGLFLQGNIPAKRDETFYRRFVYKENVKDNVLALVDDITNENAR